MTPPGWLYCHGQAVSRTYYNRLFQRIGSLHGAGDGSTTFNVPDLRGYFVRGVDDGVAGVDPDAPRQCGDVQLDKFKEHNHFNGTAVAGFTAGASSTTIALTAVGTSSAGDVIPDEGGAETRPANVALYFLIKT